MHGKWVWPAGGVIAPLFDNHKRTPYVTSSARDNHNENKPNSPLGGWSAEENDTLEAMLRPEPGRPESPRDARPGGGGGEGEGEEGEEGNPFDFAPQPVRLHRDHELFEVSAAAPTDSCLARSQTAVVTRRVPSTGRGRPQAPVPAGPLRVGGGRGQARALVRRHVSSCFQVV